MEINQFDIIRILTVKNVKYLSAPKGQKPSPNGDWTVVGILDKIDVLVAKDKTIIRIPIKDIEIIAKYDIKNIFGENKWLKNQN